MTAGSAPRLRSPYESWSYSDLLISLGPMAVCFHMNIATELKKTFVTEYQKNTLVIPKIVAGAVVVTFVYAV